MAQEHILVVDDEEPIRKTMRMTLEYEGFEVTEAPSGVEAIEAVEQDPPVGGSQPREPCARYAQEKEGCPVARRMAQLW